MQVGLMTKEFSWIITNLDAHSLDLNQFRYGGTNITTFRILDENHAIFYPIGYYRKPSTDDPENYDDVIDDSVLPNIESSLNDMMPVYPDKFMGIEIVH